jgi:cerevisin
VAGTVGGSQFGVAKSVSLIAVKILGDDGSGTVSDMSAAFDFLSLSFS